MTKEEKKEYNKQYRLKKLAEDPDWEKKRCQRRIELHPDFYAERYQKRIADNPNYCKELYQGMKDRHPDYVHQLYLRELEKNPDYNKDKYDRAKERDPDFCKKVYQRNLELHPDIVEKHKDWRNKTGYCKKYGKTKKGRAVLLSSNYNGTDKNKGFSTDQNIDAKWIIENIFNSSCVYCGDDDWKHLGADRIDNSKPHTPDNVVCACGICNMERSDKYTVEEFKEYRQTHPRTLCVDEKSWEIVEMEGIKVIKKKQI